MIRHRVVRLIPKILFTCALAAGCLLYLWDAASQSTRAANLLLLLPATLIAVLLSVSVIAEDIIEWRPSGQKEPTPDEPFEKIDLRIPILMALVGLYITIIITVGLADVATFAFVGITLALLGERRLWVLIAYPALFSVVVVSGLKAALTYEVSTLLL